MAITCEDLGSTTGNPEEPDYWLGTQIKRPVIYRITVNTGNVKDAGTDANVYITLYGTLGNGGERILDNADDNFEQGKTDIFSLQMRDIGEIEYLRIRHDNSGKKPGWFLDKIDIQNEATGTSWSFPCKRWLAVDEGDGSIDRILEPALSS